MNNFITQLIQNTFQFGRYFCMVVMLMGCSSKQSSIVESYADTGGLHLNFTFNPKNQGWLYINGNQDSIPFRYSIQKMTLKGFSPKTFRSKKIQVLHYQLDYLREDSVNTYPILKNFNEMIDSRKIRKRVYVDVNMITPIRPVINQPDKL